MHEDRYLRWYISLFWGLTASFLIFGVMVNPTTYVIRKVFTPLAFLELFVGVTSLSFMVIWSVFISRMEK